MTNTSIIENNMASIVAGLEAGTSLSLKQAQDNNSDRTIVAIICPSYSGSTLLTALLGSHSEIFGGGELQWLFSDDKKKVIDIIESSESQLKNALIWKELYENKVAENQLYDVIFDRINYKVLIDSSKRSRFFENIVPLHREKQFLFIYLLKHPMRLLASHIMHRSESPECRHMTREQAIEHILDDIHERIVYQHLIASKIGDGNRMLFVKYESLVDDTSGTIQYILNELGLPFEQDILNYQSKAHHMLGGNAGPRSQISKSRAGGASRFSSKIQQNFYKNLDGIKMDNNYRLFFTPEEIIRLNQTKKMLTLMHILGYEPIH